MKKRLWFWASLIFFTGCTQQTVDIHSARIVCSVYGAQKGILYLVTVPPAGEKRKIIDSATIVNVKDSIVFQVPLSAENRYILEVKPSFNKFYVVPDAAYIRIRGNDVTGRYTAEGSAATASLSRFKREQAMIGKHVQQLYSEIQQKNKSGQPGEAVAILQKSIADSAAALKRFAYRYADTTASPAVFLQVYNLIDFADDYKSALAFVTKAALRFPASQLVKKLKTDLQETASIYEEEFQVGDTLPFIQLPDVAGNLFSTASLKGKYYLIDFWSTWCTSCMPFEKEKTAIRETMGDKIELVSVALDDNEYDWQNIIRSRHLNWTQVIDEKMWQGPAVKTLKFDSIPFNFLVSPKGRILAKAIPPDSLLTVIKKVIE